MTSLPLAPPPVHSARPALRLAGSDPSTWPAWTDADTWEIGPGPGPGPDGGEPSAWPAWTDADTWEIGPGPGPDGGEPSHPGPAELAWDLGYRLARDGEPAELPEPDRWDRDVAFAFASGARDGKRARGLAGAYELGRALGLETEIGEPPAGLSPAEKAEYRRGFEAGQAEAEADREFEAWVAEVEGERMASAFAGPIADLDLYRPAVRELIDRIARSACRDLQSMTFPGRESGRGSPLTLGYMTMSVKLTSFGPTGPGGIALGLYEPLRQIRAAIENSAAERYEVSIAAETPINLAIQGVGSAVRVFDGGIDGGVPPGFRDSEARPRAFALGACLDQLRTARGLGGGARIATLWAVYDQLRAEVIALAQIEVEALGRHNRAKAEGGDPS